MVCIGFLGDWNVLEVGCGEIGSWRCVVHG